MPVKRISQQEVLHGAGWMNDGKKINKNKDKSVRVREKCKKENRPFGLDMYLMWDAFPLKEISLRQKGASKSMRSLSIDDLHSVHLTGNLNRSHIVLHASFSDCGVYVCV